MTGQLHIGEWRVREDCNQLIGPPGRFQIEPKLMALLVYLAERQGEVIGKETLFRAVWPDVHVGDEVIWRGISELRRILRDDSRRPRFIQTVPRRGYRFVGPVQHSEEGRPRSIASAFRLRSRVGVARLARPALFAAGILMGFAMAPIQTALEPFFGNSALPGLSAPLVCCAASSEQAPAHCDGRSGHECCLAKPRNS